MAEELQGKRTAGRRRVEMLPAARGDDKALCCGHVGLLSCLKARALQCDGPDRKTEAIGLSELRDASRRASANGRSALDQATLEWLVGLRGEQAVRCFAEICRRSPLERRRIQRTGAWMGSDKDGRRFSAGRSASRMRNTGVACHERGRVGAIERRVFLSSTPSCAEPDSGRPQDSGRVAGRVPPHLRHISRLTRAAGWYAASQLVLTFRSYEEPMVRIRLPPAQRQDQSLI